MTSELFSPQDRAQIEAHGLSEEELRAQLERFRRGPVYAHLVRPCRIGDGVRRFSEAERQSYQGIYEQAAKAGRAMKFVPASGAGTRMFQKFLQGLHGSVDEGLTAELERFPDYPFYEALQEKMKQAGHSLEDSLRRKEYRPVLEFLLGAKGLAYGESPKGLVLFHGSAEGARSAFEEQLAEAVELVADELGRCRIHFTVSEKPREIIREHLSQAASRLAKVGAVLELDDSLQKHSTDTVAVDERNLPFRDRQGRLVFRPAGHGALLENLQALAGDIVFIKNIDNVASARIRASRLDWERVLGGALVEWQGEVFKNLRRLEASESATGIEGIAEFYQSAFGGELPADWVEFSLEDKTVWLFSALHRPLRVVGVVPNQGEPGGAPFWVRDGQGRVSAQIVEAVQVDPNSKVQAAIFGSSTHFNPVNLVCGLRDFKGRPFDLRRFSDPEAGFHSLKSYEGKPLKALELPGLWNGSMAYWNSVFVEIPIETFSPVKSVEDLLRPEHR